MPGRVLVTGVSGFIGSHVALALLDAGYEVRGSVRDRHRAGEISAALKAAGADVGRLEFVELDLLDDAGWRAAMHGCRYLQHVASPLTIRMPKDRDALIRPAREGTRRALEAALEAGVERIVLTSSAAAVAYGHPHERTEPFSAADWSNTAGEGVSAYTESKTRAELDAWSLLEETGRRADLAVINPTVVLGPLLGPDPGTSSMLVKRLLDGSAPFAPRLGFSIVDVRDVAALHRLAMERPGAGGHRYIAAAGALTLIELARTLRPAFPDFASRLPRLELPDWVVRLYALADADLRANIRGLGRTRSYDTEPARALLGRPFITPRLAAAATARSLLDFGLVDPPGRKKRG